MTYVFHDHFSEDCTPAGAEQGPVERRFRFDSRRAGGGKTTAIIEQTSKMALNGQKCLIVQPTTDLIDETFDSISREHPQVSVLRFHSRDGSDHRVMLRLIAYLNNADLGGVIVLITHSTFLKIPFFYRPERWNVYIDENLNAFDYFGETLPNYHSIITDHIKVVDRSGKYGCVEPINIGRLKEIATNVGKDEVFKQVQSLAGRLISPYYDSYVVNKTHDELIKRRSQTGKLCVYSVLSPRIMDGFASVTIAAARFEETFQYHWWEREGVRWGRIKSQEGNIPDLKHPHNDTIDIYYGYDRKYSKKTRNALGCPKTNPLIVATEKLMGSKEFVRVENNDVKLMSLLNQVAGSHLIKGVSHGLNMFRHIHHAVVITANNPTSDAGNFLDEFCRFGLNDQFRAFTNHAIYQSICRTSIRDDESHEAKTWVVASKETADWLSDLFPGSRVHSLGLTQPVMKAVGRPRKHANDKERRKKSAARIKNDHARSAGFALDLKENILDEVTFHDKTDETTIKTISHFVQRFRASEFINYYGTEPRAICCTDNQFVPYLRNHHKNEYGNKNEIPCVSGAMFSVSKSDTTNRGNDNVEFVRGMWLDVENGTMRHEDFADEFPQLHVVAYNTFSHTAMKPRYRLYIPTNRPMHDQEYRAIYSEIVCILESKAYCRGSIEAVRTSGLGNQPHHGIDHRPNPCALFALPCQAKNVKDSFFVEHKADDREAIDVDAWLSNLICDYDSMDFDATIYSELGSDDTSIGSDQLSGVERAMTEWYRIGVFPGEGHDGLLSLYHSLTKLRLPVGMVTEKLHEAALSSNSPIDRRKQADRLITTLKRWANK
ncbi:hypothetical protein [Methylobacterium sp. WL120]|uniref:hypothetical protein n=1 Tax=Methylobacterium sp. WL120 TaxID=2603887 RepID=UPI0011C76DA3|nr:hypothetical protein [Methylobacterium sp. WL120]TXM66863.1 hypothetical protein FV229_11595 [Methylobacterium sp. WL120]